ncbi:RNA 3'-phosphate cyclase [Candidatus Micrarchaeota archaeon]|nr:RNA 3'-phosphate cyclase [Candidatus Micrarchaeota archaeon]
MSHNFIEIDGSDGEGGGQIIRTALSLSAITQKPIKITNIRANRPNPGLAAQHVTCAKAVRSVCRGTLEGAEIGSKTLSFIPGSIVGGKYEFNIGTAGSAILVAQTLLPVLFAAAKPSELKIVGGTHVMKAPSYDYFERVFLPAITRFGAVASAKMHFAGYYPKGGGLIELSISPSFFSGSTTWQTDDQHTQAIVSIANLDRSIAVREKKVFVQNGIESVYIHEEKSPSTGTSVTCWSGFRGSFVLGEIGKRAEQVSQEALDALKAEKFDVDVHLADQLLIYAALASGSSSYCSSAISSHLKTNARIVSLFLSKKIAFDTSNNYTTISD